MECAASSLKDVELFDWKLVEDLDYNVIREVVESKGVRRGAHDPVEEQVFEPMMVTENRVIIKKSTHRIVNLGPNRICSFY